MHGHVSFMNRLIAIYIVHIFMYISIYTDNKSVKFIFSNIRQENMYVGLYEQFTESNSLTNCQKNSPPILPGHDAEHYMVRRA